MSLPQGSRAHSAYLRGRIQVVQEGVPRVLRRVVILALWRSIAPITDTTLVVIVIHHSTSVTLATATTGP